MQKFDRFYNGEDEETKDDAVPEVPAGGGQ